MNWIARPEELQDNSPMNEPQARRRRRSNAEVRELLLKAARELFAERGYANTTTREIAARAGAMEVLLYRYFNSKAQLFENAISEPFDDFMRRIIADRPPLSADGPGAAELGADYVKALYRILLSERQLILSLITTRAYEAGGDGVDRPRGLQHYFAEAEESLKAGYEQAKATPPIRPELSARISFAAVVAAALLQDWLFEDVADPDEVASALATFVTRGLFDRN